MQILCFKSLMVNRGLHSLRGRAAPVAHTKLAHQLGGAPRTSSSVFGPMESLTGDRKKKPNKIYYLSVHILQTFAFYAVGNTNPVVLSWCVWNCLVADLQKFTLGFFRNSFSMQVWMLLTFSSLAGLLWDPFPPELLTILCAQWCSLSIIFCRITEDSAVTTFEALKARVRELERQLSRGDRYKCLICMVSSTPLVVMNQKCLGVFALSLLRREEGFLLFPFFLEGRTHPHPCTLWRISFLLNVSARLF